MNRIGIIGGMSCESTLHYYDEINRQVNLEAGGLTSADLVLRSVNFEEYHELMEIGDWDEIAKRLTRECLDLRLLNKCDYVAIATNTMHKVADIVIGPHAVDDGIWPSTPKDVTVPLIHIGDCIARECEKVNAKRVLLLGTKFTMTEDFLKNRLAMHDIETIDLSGCEEEIDEINRIIFEELCHGTVTCKSRMFMSDFLGQFMAGAGPKPDAIILGCTELDMIIDSDFVGEIPVIDSTAAHIKKIVELCLSD